MASKPSIKGVIAPNRQSENAPANPILDFYHFHFFRLIWNYQLQTPKSQNKYVISMRMRLGKSLHGVEVRKLRL